MKCNHCGSDLIPGARFCDSCGAPVGEAAAAGLSTEPAPQTGFKTEEPFVQAPPYTPSSQTSKPSPYTSSPAQAPKPPSYTPQVSYSSSQPNVAQVFQPGEKIMGLPAEHIGIITLVLGGVGLLFSCVGCGGIFSILGLITGFLSLKTPERKKGTIGMILSGLGLLVSLIMVCIFLFFSSSIFGGGGGYYDGF